MRILFCADAFTIDGVASYNMYLAAALRTAGHQVAVLATPLPRKGFQDAHLAHGVEVLYCGPAFAGAPGGLARARRFVPDVVVSDARRAFPLVRRIREATRAKGLVVFHDPPRATERRGRTLDEVAAHSDAWIAPEQGIYQTLAAAARGVPVRFFPRPLSGLLRPTELPPRDPFRLLHLGRLSGWKTWGPLAIVESAARLRTAIPSLEITVVGAGGGLRAVRGAARRANREAGRRYVHAVGAQRDPAVWMQAANLVSAGATSAMEAIMVGRPVLALGGFWLGLVVPENLAHCVACHFGDRDGAGAIKGDVEPIVEAVIAVHRQWDDAGFRAAVQRLRSELSAEVDSVAVAREIEALVAGL